MSPNMELQTRLAQASTAQTEKMQDSDQKMIVDQSTEKTTMIVTTQVQPREFNVVMQGQGDEEVKHIDLGQMIPEETKVEQLRPKPIPVQLKKVTKLVG